MTIDEGIRFEPNLEKMGKLQPAFKADGVITAANSSQISDGAAALLLMSADKAKGTWTACLARASSPAPSSAPTRC